MSKTKNIVSLVEPVLGIRQEKALKRRKHLSNVVLNMISEKGFDAISVNDVAEQASMSVGGLYRHIKTKNDLLEMVCDQIHLDTLAELKEAASKEKGIPNKLRAAFSLYWTRHWDAAPAIMIAYREYRSLSDETQKRYLEQQNKVAAFFGDMIRAGVLVEEFTEVDEHLLAHQMMFMAHMRALKGWTMKDYSCNEVLKEHLAMIFSRLEKTAIK